MSVTLGGGAPRLRGVNRPPPCSFVPLRPGRGWVLGRPDAIDAARRQRARRSARFLSPFAAGALSPGRASHDALWMVTLMSR